MEAIPTFPMDLRPGAKIGAYEIVSAIGKGGMGEVWRARDPRLGRDVAIKVAAQHFSDRFEREARAIAALNHANICTLHDVGPDYLVMELIEGPTLADRIKQGPIQLDEALNIARQIADALDAAHEKNIVHRDLKPGNVKIRPDGSVKVLDFGLAKSGAPEAALSHDSPTLMQSPTLVGMILGTAAYMAPEQARGKTVDKRADIWSFGVVLYEMVTGKRLFEGEDLTETLASVVKDKPDLSSVPAQVRPLLNRCLEKDPKKRLRDIGDAWELLAEAPRSPAAFSWSWIVVAALVIALGVLAFVHFGKTPPPVRTLRYTISAPEKARNLESFAISPDGRILVMAADVAGKRQLWLRPLDSLQSQPMPGTDGASFPFWSPDNRYIGFFAQGKLKKIPVGGGPAQSLVDTEARGASWGRDNVIVYSASATEGYLRRISAAGGAPVDLPPGDGFFHFPIFLPDGRHFVYQVNGLSPERVGAYLVSIDGKESRRILPDFSGVAIAPGQILFVRGNALMAQLVDAAGNPSGEPIQVAPDVSSAPNGYAPISVSQTGILVYQNGQGTQGLQLFWFDRDGRNLGDVGAQGGTDSPAIAPDGRSVAFERIISNISAEDLWLRDVARGAERRFTADQSFNTTPSWSPRGDRIVFRSTRGAVPGNLYLKPTNGSGETELLLANGNDKVPTQWSRDGRFIVYEEQDAKTRWDLWFLPLEGTDRKPIPFLRSEFNEMFGQLSPDSHWMAYTSDESGRREVYVRPFPPGEGQWSISLAGGEQPRWRGDGKELYFIGADGKMMAAAVKGVFGDKPAFEAETPQALFSVNLAQSFNGSFAEFDVTADGKRFLINTVGGAAVSPLNVVVNWDLGLKK